MVRDTAPIAKKAPVAQRRRKRRIVLLLLLGLAVYVTWLRRPRYEWYTSPPIAAGTHLVRFKVLVPAGWEADPPDYMDGRWVVFFFPKQPTRWQIGGLTERLPKTLRRFLGLDGDYVARLEVRVTETSFQGDIRLGTEAARASGYHPAVTCQVASRTVGTGPGCEVVYVRANSSVFHATYRQVCESLTVVR